MTTNCLLLFHRNLTQALKYQNSNFRECFLLLHFLNTDYTIAVDEEKPKIKWPGLGKFLLPWNVFSQPSHFLLPAQDSVHENNMGDESWGKGREKKIVILSLFYLRPNTPFKRQKMLILQKGALDLSPLTCKCWSWLDFNSFTGSFFLAQNDFSYH